MLCVVTHRRTLLLVITSREGSQVASMYHTYDIYTHISPGLASTRLLTISHQLDLSLSCPILANGILYIFPIPP